MFLRNSLMWIALSLIALPVCVAATSVEKIRNEKVLVTEDTLASGETESFAGDRPGILVFLTGNTAVIFPANGKPWRETVKRGDTLPQSADEKGIRNEGSSALSFLHIKFLTAGIDETWGMTGLSPNYKPLLENQFARAYDIKIPAQTFEPQHTHHDRVVVCLAGAKLEHILPNGDKQPSTLETGEVVWRLGATHIGHNMGQTDLWVIAIEPK